ncbi:MAG: FliA/WhiG family RNA polymerase sigma factor [Nonomuraea sp.]|nr:FliA/WhiG family RNA polymerase sigma factor [Nonomuraea sp.]
MVNEALDEAWRSFREDRNREARNDLMVHYTGLVRMVAAKVASGLPSMVDREDLVSYGMFGLIGVLESYNPERGVKFETYATPRIRGSIIDELRKQDWVPRSVRSKVRDIEKVRTELQAEFNREPTDEEIALSLGVTVHDLWQLQGEAHNSTMAGLDDGNDDRASIAELTFDVASNPEDLFVAKHEIATLMADAIATMSERDKTILVLYYLQEMTLAQIGEVLGVTESRVCQLQSKVLSSLRESLGHGALSAA